MKLLVAALAILAAFLFTHHRVTHTSAPVARAPLHSADPRLPMHATSLNWAGYDVVARPTARFRRVSATWTQPAVACDVNTDSSVSVWVGLDGDGSNTVEQVGTAVDCVFGQAYYTAWYEMYPDWPAQFALPIHPGDQIGALVRVSSRGAFHFLLSNLTTGQRANAVGWADWATRSSAEAIIEAPSSLLGVVPLAPFMTTTLDHVAVDGRPLGSFLANDRIDMVDTHGNVKAQTSPIDTATFSVDWRAY